MEIVTLRTVGGRLAEITIPCTVHQARQTAAETFGFLPPSVRLVRRGKVMHDSDDLLVGGDDLVAIGKAVPKPRAAASTNALLATPKKDPTGLISKSPICSPIVGDALPRMHCPDGLIEVVSLARSMGPVAGAILQHHPTVQWISNFVSNDSSRLELVLRQCQRDCPPFLQWVNDYPDVFLQLVNSGSVGDTATGVFSFHSSSGSDELLVEGFPKGDSSAWVEIEQGDIIEFFVSATCDDVVVVEGEMEDKTQGGNYEQQEEEDLNEMEVGHLQSLERQLHELMLNTSQPLERMLAMSRLAAAYRSRYERLGDCEESATRYTRDAMSLAVESFAMFEDARDDIVEVFSCADAWFAERHPFSAFVARVGHQLVEQLAAQERQGQGDSVPDCFVEARQLCDFSKNADTVVVVLYPSYHDRGTEVFVVSRGAVMVRSVPSSLDQLEEGVAFLSALTTDDRRQVVALKLWSERLATWYNQFIEPIADVLPAPSGEFSDSAAPLVCLLTPKLPHLIPFSAFLDKHNVPLMAKYAIYQAFSIEKLLQSGGRSTSRGAAQSMPSSYFDVDGHQPWMTSSLLRSLGCQQKRRERKNRELLTVMHVSKWTVSLQAEKDPLAELVVVEKYCAEADWPQFVGSAALIQAMPSVNMAPYEFFRVFYVHLAEGLAVARAVRRASLAAAQAFPLEPWAWASMCLIQSGSFPLSGLPQAGGAPVATVAAIPVEPLVNDAKKPKPIQRRLTGLTDEVKYCVDKGIPDIYDAMVNCLVGEKPGSEVCVLETLIECLCSREQQAAPQPAPLAREADSTTVAGAAA